MPVEAEVLYVDEIIEPDGTVTVLHRLQLDGGSCSCGGRALRRPNQVEFYCTRTGAVLYWDDRCGPRPDTDKTCQCGGQTVAQGDSELVSRTPFTLRSSMFCRSTGKFLGRALNVIRAIQDIPPGAEFELDWDDPLFDTPIPTFRPKGLPR